MVKVLFGIECGRIFVFWSASLIGQSISELLQAQDDIHADALYVDWAEVLDGARREQM